MKFGNHWSKVRFNRERTLTENTINEVRNHWSKVWCKTEVRFIG